MTLPQDRFQKPRPRPIVPWLAMTCLLSVGCQMNSYANRGAALGGLTGAGVGAAVGHATGHTGSGALIGSAVGLVTGNAIGSGMDNIRAENRALIEQQAAARGRMASLQDAAEMTRAGLADDLIVTHFQTRGLATPPTPADLISLKQQGVSDYVLRALQNMPTTATAPAVVPATYVEPAPEVIVEEHYYADPYPHFYCP